MATLNNNLNVIMTAQDKTAKAFAKAGGAIDKLQAKVDKYRGGIKKAALAGAAMLAGLAALTLGAREQVRTQAVLAKAIENTGESAEEVSPKAEKMFSSLQALTGVSDELQREALAKLVVGLGSTEKAMAALPAVMDVAAVSGKDLGSTTDALVKTLAGQTQTVRGTALEFDKAATFGERLAEIQKTMGGAAEAAADPFGRMQATLADLGDAIGVALMPAFNAVADAVTGLVTKFNEMDPWVHTLVASIGVLLGVLGVGAGLLLVLPLITTAIGVLGAAVTLLLGPVGWAAAAIGALVWVFSDSGDAAEEAEPQVVKLGEALGEDVVEGADAAVDALGEVDDALISTGEIMDAIGGSSATLAKAFKQRFGEMPDVAKDALSLIETAIADASGSNFDTFNEGLIAQQKALRDTYGQDIPDELIAASNAMQKAWIEGPGKALSGGADVSLSKVTKTLSEGLTGKAVDAIEGSAVAMERAWEEGPQASIETGLDGLAVIYANKWEGLLEDGTKVVFDGAGDMTRAIEDGAVSPVEAAMATMDESIATHTESMADSFAKLGEGMAGPLVGAVNQISDSLEFGLNEVYLPWINNILSTLKTLGSNGLLGNQIGSLSGLPDSFPTIDLPHFRTGTMTQPGGPSVLNEAGGEIINLPSGAGVIDAGNSTRLVEAIKAAGALSSGSREFTNLGTIQVVADDPRAFLDELELLS